MERADTGSVPVTGLRFSKFFRSPIDNCFCKLALKRSDSATQLSLERKNFGSRTRLQETDSGQLFLVPHVLWLPPRLLYRKISKYPQVQMNQALWLQFIRTPGRGVPPRPWANFASRQIFDGCDEIKLCGGETNSQKKRQMVRWLSEASQWTTVPAMSDFVLFER